VSTPAEELFGPRYPGAAQYVELLADRGVTWGLIGPREVERLWDRHVLNSVALSDLIPAGSTVADIGSGAGLPGIPLALLRPDLQVTLLEPLLRRSTFLTQAVDELGITDRVSVVAASAKNQHASFDVVASRALAPLGRLVGWCAPLRAPDGAILALKGSSASDEVQAAASVLRRHHLTASVVAARAHPRSEPTTVVRLVSA